VTPPWLLRAAAALRLRWAPDGALNRRALARGASTGERGAIGEELAARHLQRAGLRLLARRWRAATAEVDLLALDPDGTLVVCEVKSATLPARFASDPSAARFRPGLHLGPDQLRRLATAARDAARRRGAPRWRVELVEVALAPGAAPALRRTTVACPAGAHRRRFRETSPDR